MKQILLVGESWTSNTTHFKGFDTFQNISEEEESTKKEDDKEKN